MNILKKFLGLSNDEIKTIKSSSSLINELHSNQENFQTRIFSTSKTNDNFPKIKRSLFFFLF